MVAAEAVPGPSPESSATVDGAGQDNGSGMPSKWPLRRRLRRRRRELVAAQSAQDRAGAARAITAAAVDALAQLGRPVTARAMADLPERGHRASPVRERDRGELCTVAAYESLAVEPPTELLIETLREHGVRVIVPITLDDLTLDWREAPAPGEAPDSTPPLGPEAIGDACLVLTPGLSVDTSGTRMGQGGGCYDKALPLRHPEALVVTLLHDGELHDAATEPLPRDAHDLPVDGVITPSRGLVLFGAPQADPGR